jgi:hypothetical protein
MGFEKMGLINSNFSNFNNKKLMKTNRKKSVRTEVPFRGFRGKNNKVA